jgi:hypothetical protein
VETWWRFVLQQHVNGTLFFQHAFSFTRDAILTTVTVVLQVERFGNSSGTNYKGDDITFSDAFGFHSSAFRFMKWFAFHVYILYYSILKKRTTEFLFSVVNVYRCSTKQEPVRLLHFK